MVQKFMILKRIVNFLNKKNLFIFLPIGLFTLIFILFSNSIPYLDGNIDFVQSYDFFKGGYAQYFNNWKSVHPPFKLLITSIFFHILGINSFSYNIPGIIFGVTGIISIYLFSKKIFSENVGRISSLLLSVSPIFISTSLFQLRDFTVINLLLLSILFLSINRLFFAFFIMSLAAMTKETALLFPISFLFTQVIFLFIRGNTKKIKKDFLYIFLPLLVFFIWSYFLKINGKSSWQEWIFTSTASKGTIYTIINNILTFNFLNKYAYQSWEQLFILNYNWVYWLSSFVGFIFIFNKNFLKKVKKTILKGGLRTRIIISIILFNLFYILGILSLQTFTIPRYHLPIIPFLLIALSLSLNLLLKTKILKYFTACLLSVVILISLFYSNDPISKKLWGNSQVLGENLYGLNNHFAGNDGITYNIQYLVLIKKRTIELSSKRSKFDSNNCRWIFPDPNNDLKTIKILNLNSDYISECKNK